VKARTVLTRLFIAIVFIYALYSETTAQSQWPRFVSPNNDFSISFPSEPKHETHVKASREPPLELYTLVFNKHLLNIGIKELRPAPKTQRQRASALSGAVKSQLDWIEKEGGQLLKHQTLSDGGVQFDFIGRIDAKTLTYTRDRIYIYGTRYYQLRCLSLNLQGIDESIASQFFNSFRLTTSEAVRGKSSDRTKSGANGIPLPATHEK
jgi:hypothetical protein